MPDVAWASLKHAYGSAEDIPALLARAEVDHRGGHVPGSTMFDLWSALCHQGDTYTASCPAVPFLVRLAAMTVYRHRYDPLYLAACIELSRMEGRGPQVPSDLVPHYRSAIQRGLEIASDALDNTSLDADSRQAYRACVAAFNGQSLTARNILDEEDA